MLETTTSVLYLQEVLTRPGAVAEGASVANGIRGSGGAFFDFVSAEEGFGARPDTAPTHPAPTYLAPLSDSEGPEPSPNGLATIPEAGLDTWLSNFLLFAALPSPSSSVCASSVP